MPSTPLEKLEKQVARAVSHIEELERQNESLRKKAATLETSLAAATADDEPAEWRQERDAIRERLEALTEHLESALAE